MPLPMPFPEPPRRPGRRWREDFELAFWILVIVVFIGLCIAANYGDFWFKAQILAGAFK